MQCCTVIYNYPFIHWNHKNESNSKPLTFFGSHQLYPQMIYQWKWNFCNSINIFRWIFSDANVKWIAVGINGLGIPSKMSIWDHQMYSSHQQYQEQHLCNQLACNQLTMHCKISCYHLEQRKWINMNCIKNCCK